MLLSFVLFGPRCVVVSLVRLSVFPACCVARLLGFCVGVCSGSALAGFVGSAFVVCCFARVVPCGCCRSCPLSGLFRSVRPSSFSPCFGGVGSLGLRVRFLSSGGALGRFVWAVRPAVVARRSGVVSFVWVWVSAPNPQNTTAAPTSTPAPILATEGQIPLAPCGLCGGGGKPPPFLQIRLTYQNNCDKLIVGSTAWR